MRVTVTTELRLCRTPDGQIWTGAAGSYEFWTRYLDAFSAITVVARVNDVATVDDNARRVDGPNVGVWALPYFVGPAQFVRAFRTLRRSLAASMKSGDAVILRVPSSIGSLAARILTSAGKPFSLEVVG